MSQHAITHTVELPLGLRVGAARVPLRLRSIQVRQHRTPHCLGHRRRHRLADL